MLCSLFKEKNAKSECATLARRRKILSIFPLFKDNYYCFDMCNVLGSTTTSLSSIELYNFNRSTFPQPWVKTKKVMGLNLIRVTWVSFMLIMGLGMRSASLEIHDWEWKSITSPKENVGVNSRGKEDQILGKKDSVLLWTKMLYAFTTSKIDSGSYPYGAWQLI